MTAHSIYTGVGRDGTGENSEKVSVIVTLHSMNTGAPTFSEFLPSHHGPFFHTILREYARAHTHAHTRTHTHTSNVRAQVYQLQPIPAYMRLRISIRMPNFRMPNFDSVNLCTRVKLVVHKLTESKFGIRIEIRSLMYAGIGCIQISNKRILLVLRVRAC